MILLLFNILFYDFLASCFSLVNGSCFSLVIPSTALPPPSLSLSLSYYSFSTLQQLNVNLVRIITIKHIKISNWVKPLLNTQSVFFIHHCWHPDCLLYLMAVITRSEHDLWETPLVIVLALILKYLRHEKTEERVLEVCLLAPNAHSLGLFVVRSVPQEVRKSWRMWRSVSAK